MYASTERAAGRDLVLAALADGRSLPLSRLAHEAGLGIAGARNRVHTLVEAGALAVEQHGRNRYYRLAEPVGAGAMAAGMPIRSDRAGTAAHTIRQARTCYDHLAGRLGVRLMAVWLERDLLAGADERVHSDRPDAPSDRPDAPSGWGRAVDYRLTPAGTAFLAEFGIRPPSGRRLVRYCVDWTEQRPHLAGALGRGLLDRLFELDWIARLDSSRAVRVTPAGTRGLQDTFGIAA